MRVVVAGGRDFHQKKFVYQSLDQVHSVTPIEFLGHGAAEGVDKLAGLWASERGISNKSFPVTPEQWRRLGRGAGHMRNGYMLDQVKPDLLITFPGGPGTANCTSQAFAKGIEVKHFDPFVTPDRSFAQEPSTSYNHIAIVGDIITANDVKNGAPFSADGRSVLEELCEQSGIILTSCLVTCVFMTPVAGGNALSHFRSIRENPEDGSEPFRWQSARYVIKTESEFELVRFRAEIHKWQPKVVIAMGAIPLWSLTGYSEPGKVENLYLLNDVTGYGHVIGTYSLWKLHYNKKLWPKLVENFSRASRRAKIKLPRSFPFSYDTPKITERKRR